MDSADRSADEAFAHGGLLVHRNRPAASVGAHLAVSRCGRAAAHSRRSRGAKDVAAGDSGMAAEDGELPGAAGGVFATALSAANVRGSAHDWHCENGRQFAIN